MVSDTKVGVSAEFLEGPSGSLFTLTHRVESSRGVVVWVPPFAEEMNKCRRMMSLQSRAMAAAGFSVFQFDFFGTGDSSGHFAEVDVNVWSNDLDFLINHASRVCPQVPLVLLCCRFGALLAAARVNDDVAGLIFWQPVLSGKTFLSQFLRVRVMADKARGLDCSTKSLMAGASAGNSVEVAGYEMSPTLIQQLSDLTLKDAPPKTPVHWIQLNDNSEMSISPGSTKIIEGWRKAGSAVHAHSVTGPPFWSTVEIAVANDLIEKTTACAEVVCD